MDDGAPAAQRDSAWRVFLPTSFVLG